MYVVSIGENTGNKSESDNATTALFDKFQMRQNLWKINGVQMEIWTLSHSKAVSIDNCWFRLLLLRYSQRHMGQKKNSPCG